MQNRFVCSFHSLLAKFVYYWNMDQRQGEVTVWVSTFFAANYFKILCCSIKGHRDHGKKSQKPAGL